jgi:hypothetical protein
MLAAVTATLGPVGVLPALVSIIGEYARSKDFFVITQGEITINGMNYNYSMHIRSSLTGEWKQTDVKCPSIYGTTSLVGSAEHNATFVSENVAANVENRYDPERKVWDQFPISSCLYPIISTTNQRIYYSSYSNTITTSTLPGNYINNYSTHARSNPAIVIAGNYIHIIGGSSRTTACLTFRRFDSFGQIKSHLPNFPISVRFSGSCVYRSMIVVGGGSFVEEDRNSTQVKSTNQIWTYPIHPNGLPLRDSRRPELSWKTTEITPFPSARMKPTLLVVDDIMYVIGGRFGLFQQYADEKWITLKGIVISDDTYIAGTL